jgi:hypothetical protein
MRDYSKVSPQFWIGKTGKALRKHGFEAQMVGLYLLTSPHANMLGLYYVPQAFIGHETGLGMEGALKGLQGCIDAGFCHYDEDSEVVWVVEMARFQVGDELHGKDLRIKGVQNEYESLPENPYLGAFYDMYAKAFCMTEKRGESKAFEAPSKPLRSQEQEQEKEQEQKQDQTHVASAPAGCAAIVVASPPAERRAQPRGSEDVRSVFAYWQEVMSHPHAKLDDKRAKAIGKRLSDGYTVGELCQAIDGCKRSPHHMGQNEQRTVYDDIELICRDGTHVDKFIKLAGPVGIADPGLRRQVDVLQEWMEKP